LFDSWRKARIDAAASELRGTSAILPVVPRAPKKAAARAVPARTASPAAAGARSRRSPGKTGTSGATALVEQLEALGVDRAFGIPGVHNLAIFDALRRSSIRTILVRHEQTAVFAADGFARATGRVAAAITTTGPGAANTAAAMGEARASRSPVLHISTQIETRLLLGRGGKWSLHESATQRELMEAVSVWSAHVARADAIPSMVHRAATEAFTGRRGPAFVEIPHDLLDADVRWEARAPLPTRRRSVDERQLARAAEALAGARKPMIWVGGGAIASGAGDAVAALAEALDAAVVTTYGGKGILPREHPLLVGFPPHQPEVGKLLAAADALVVIGSDLDGMNTQGWRMPLPRPRIMINTVADDARRNYAGDVVVEADAREALEALLPMLQSRASGATAKRLTTMRAKTDAVLRAHKEFGVPYAFARGLEEVVPADAIVVCDMAVAGYWVGAYFRPSAALSFAYPLGWGTLGFALPAAIGAAATGRRTLAIAGDAGALFAIGELATAAQEELPLVLLVVNDEGYGMLRFDERERFGAEFASDLRTPDFVALARSFGLTAKRATEADVHAQLRAAFKRKGPSVIELHARWAPPLTTSPRWPLKGKPEARP